MRPDQLTYLRRGLWIVGTTAVVTVALTAWWLWEDRLKNHRDDGLVSSQVLVSRDGRTLTAAVSWSPCQEAGPELAARESSDAVAVTIRTGISNLSHPCETTKYQQVAVTLREPLGQRRLVDASTGGRIPPFDGAFLLTPRYLPTGYAQTDAMYQEEPGPRPGLPYLLEREHEPGPAWTRYYREGSGLPSLAIAQITGRGQQGGGEGKAVSVGGLSGRFFDGPGSEHGVTWFDGTFTYMVCDSGAHLAPGELLKIAERLGGGERGGGAYGPAALPR
ncbi:hypothetical protein [Streptomyces varsoviensis]|uniref:DUF4367 domain-containing protein n=1 Tax=Streptomyces varsoviensis TaxID=67373 RepID=A0ABR5ITH0_9ACTN|nr:hypothetical protein [Streptomyces varsoviensis]KOG56242.1 hypothetical protein ADK38_43370 [Streptomyces varsoviensis]